jgi:pimeloyl-ACP methyl ester carboxylesterase
MLDEQQYIHRLNAAEPSELAMMLLRPTPEEELVLRTHLGDERYERMHEMALRAATTRAATARKGNVVVIHGIMGGELSSRDIVSATVDKIWLNYVQLFLGRFNRLRLKEDGETEVDPHVVVSATGMIKKYYGEIMMSLQQQNWNVCQFYFDWRKDIRVASRQLAAKAAQQFGADAKFHIVAHSMGGLVARWYIRENRARWDTQQSRLIMLGTPNYGSFAVPQIITGLEGLVRKIATLDRHNDRRQIAAIANSFPGSLQMMPSPAKMPQLEALYDPATWAAHAMIPKAFLDNAKQFHADLADVHDDRMVYVAGYGQDTHSNITALDRVGEEGAYEHTRKGDGRVPWTLGFLPRGKVYFVFESHGGLPMNTVVHASLTELLETGRTNRMTDQEPPENVKRDAATAQPDEQTMVAAEQAELEVIAMQTYPERGGTRSAQQADEQASRAEDLVVRGWIDNTVAPRSEAMPVRSGAGTGEIEVPKIAIDLWHGSITEWIKSDVIAAGVYVGVRPEGATKLLDETITEGYRAGNATADERLITQLLERGVIHGGLAQPFILEDPRDKGRLIAIAGMGEPGRFGTPECMVLARELVWTLGKLRRKHLGTVLIGSGVGNLATRDAVLAWLRGIRRALLGVAPADCLRKVTFLEYYPDKVLDIDHALQTATEESPLKGRLVIDYTPLAGAARTAVEEKAYERARVRAEEQVQRQKDRLQTGGIEDRKDEVPARMTVTFDSSRKSFRFGAITATASVPEREVAVDPALVEQAAHELSKLSLIDEQRRSGDFLRKLILPREFDSQLSGKEPLVVLVDRQTARTPWEMLVQRDAEAEHSGADRQEFSPDAFLGTARGLTRQLRTIFAPPPEPPPPYTRTLAVLIVADPAADAPLPGAQREGVELRDLFDAFNSSGAGNQVRVKTMLGPSQATRYAVLRELMTHEYDVLHFAGHCAFDPDPARTGWIFTQGAVLTANELNRIDRVPRFVFSNACESGVTPAEANLSLAPSFAEAFFARGVANFVCTAWPINDAGALMFAQTVYTALLNREPMHEAMRRARQKIAGDITGAGTWGAYQHYGNPYYRFFDRKLVPQKAVAQPDAPAKTKRK